jgi:multidrug efflux pump subunit AcrA (membrane-fusion protein)/rubrerythrin
MKIPIKSSYIAPFLVALFLTLGMGALLSGCGGDHGTGGSQVTQEQLYTCGMHPQVIQNKPGNCPICGMKLTPVRKQAGSTAAASSGERKVKFYKSTMNPGETSPGPAKDSMGMDMVPVYETEGASSDSQLISVEPMTVQDMNIKTGTVTRGPLRRVVRTVGVIEYNEASLGDVTTKFRGWVEKLYVDTTGQLVMKGDPLFEIYSPELYSAQREYVLALEGTNTPGDPSLKASARTKLKFFDISDEQIAELERTREPRKTLRVESPQDGFVVEKTVVRGQLADAGTKLYRLADLGLVWVEGQIYEQDLDYVKLGQEATVTLSYLPDREFRGRVTYVYPNVDEKTRTARVRMEFHNPGYFLKPGMFATVQVLSELAPSVLLVPNMAVLRSGAKNTVFVALEGGQFAPRSVALGLQAENDTYQVLSGLSEGDRIVTSGQFLLDSESQLREAIQKMSGPKAAAATTAPHEGHEAGGLAPTKSEAVPAGPAGAQANVVKYICPMPEHVSIEYDHPGKCPLCGMTLVPVGSAALSKIQPGGKLLYYTCPMPEHSDVHESKPGNCPKCGMTLIPVMEPPKPAPAFGPQPSLAAPKAGEGGTVNPQPSVLYTCPMADHADVVSDHPGKCPKCEMDLVPTSTVAHGKVAEENWRKQHPPTNQP